MTKATEKSKKFWKKTQTTGIVYKFSGNAPPSPATPNEILRKEKGTSLMLAKIRDDTWNVLNMHNPKLEKRELSKHPRWWHIIKQTQGPAAWLKVPSRDTRRNNNVIMTSKRRRDVVLTS